MITGVHSAVEKAKVIIDEYLSSTAVENIPFDPSITEFLVGKGGKVVRNVQETTGMHYMDISITNANKLVVFNVHVNEVE